MLTPDGSLLVVLILFIILVPIVNRILFKPISHILNERERLTSGSSTDARAILSRIDHRLAEYEEGIRAARSDGYRLVEARRAEANAARQQKLESSRGEAERKISEARSSLASDAVEARAHLEGDAREIANRISSTLLGRSVGGAQ